MMIIIKLAKDSTSSSYCGYIRLPWEARMKKKSGNFFVLSGLIFLKNLYSLKMTCCKWIVYLRNFKDYVSAKVNTCEISAVVEASISWVLKTVFWPWICSISAFTWHIVWNVRMKYYDNYRQLRGKCTILCFLCLPLMACLRIPTYY